MRSRHSTLCRTVPGSSAVPFSPQRQRVPSPNAHARTQGTPRERPYCRASSIISAVRRCSSSRPRGTLRCVERCCPSAAQARRSETCSCVRTCSMQARRRLLRLLQQNPGHPERGGQGDRFSIMLGTQCSIANAGSVLFTNPYAPLLALLPPQQQHLRRHRAWGFAQSC